MEISTEFMVLVPVVVGVVQVIKMAGLSSRWVPLTSLVLATVGAVFLGGAFDPTTVVQGLMAGLAACGLWSGVKATIA